MASLRTLGPLQVHPLNLGGNVFGWSADEDESFAVLDAYRDAGGNFVDTADSYLLEGGESETIIGRWLASRGRPDNFVVATKVSSKKDRKGLAPDNIRIAADESLARLQSDTIDLYYAHRDHEDTPLEDSLGTFAELIDAGKIRTYGLSNFSAARLKEALAVCDREGIAKPVALQPHYNLVERPAFEGDLQAAAADGHLGVMPYFALAKGFLTGKYRAGEDHSGKSEIRTKGAAAYLDDARGPRVLDALDAIAQEHGVTDAAVALAWLRDRPTVVAPIASARTTEQLAGILPMAELELTAEQTRLLDEASS